MFSRFFMNRPTTSNRDDEESAPVAPIAPPTRTQTAPPGYTKLTPGGKLEFLRDIEAYQAACLIKKVVDIPVEEPAPAYDLHDFPNTSASEPSDDKEVFRAKFQKKLSELKECIERRVNGKSSKRALSDKAILLICAAILLLIGGFAGVWVAVLHHIALIVTLGILWVATLIKFCCTGWSYYHKRKFLTVINVTLLKVDSFERLDEQTVKGIKRGVDHALPGSYWADAALAVRRNRGAN
ncbi:hypothetical protein TWF506_006365 [Arthrobotrys conoides]|uniref:Uncharacterized protein n=1 Tax=Arthrobotrys conoides TaxID=74498 RepID=A0AAN8NBZ9_9PEZI